uniref:Uncharacterized protein n=1 Tax=Photinus pyralis TaxID=7054 RepID=A0A1Y1L842_PHOPY
MLNLGYISFLKTYNQYNFNKQLYTLLQKCTNTTSVRQVSHKNKPTPLAPLTFNETLNYRRNQAKRSILVQVQSMESYKELYSYISTLGNVHEMLHYVTSTDQLHFIIVEFDNEEQVSNIIQNSSHINSGESFPIHSNFLWFKATNRKNSKLKIPKNFKLGMENGNQIPSKNEICNLLLGQDNTNHQIQTLHDVTKLNDVATRLRFLTTRQVELSVAGMFPNAVAYPFGSSVNGFGKMGCDLDIVFRLAEEQVFCRS